MNGVWARVRLQLSMALLIASLDTGRVYELFSSFIQFSRDDLKCKLSLKFHSVAPRHSSPLSPASCWIRRGWSSFLKDRTWTQKSASCGENKCLNWSRRVNWNLCRFCYCRYLFLDNAAMVGKRSLIVVLTWSVCDALVEPHLASDSRILLSPSEPYFYEEDQPQGPKS